MVQEIILDQSILSKKCEKVKKGEDVSKIIKDLIDTGNKYNEIGIGCVGISANQIGYNKRIIAISKKDGKWGIFINPSIVSIKRDKFVSEEGCLSIEGTREVKRYNYIELVYYDKNFKIKKLMMKNNTAVIAQHLVDHLNGILV